MFAVLVEDEGTVRKVQPVVLQYKDTNHSAGRLGGLDLGIQGGLSTDIHKLLQTILLGLGGGHKGLLGLLCHNGVSGHNLGGLLRLLSGGLSFSVLRFFRFCHVFRGFNGPRGFSGFISVSSVSSGTVMVRSGTIAYDICTVYTLAIAVHLCAFGISQLLGSRQSLQLFQFFTVLGNDIGLVACHSCFTSENSIHSCNRLL